jgi:hypothetical protein
LSIILFCFATFSDSDRIGDHCRSFSSVSRLLTIATASVIIVDHSLLFRDFNDSDRIGDHCRSFSSASRL